ncbi:MAG TPA: hypothetical protein VLH59_01395 [Ignavibacteriaceae bacterium]|nr:hypothetical protein [Ignavibacteriaceae bacterium]
MKSVIISVAGLILIFLLLFFINGCATIFGWGGDESVNILSSPDEAKVVITEQDSLIVYEGITPAIVSLEKYNGYFSGKTYTIKISKEGYIDKTVVVDTKTNGWYLGGNLLLGGLIGWLIVDPLTGAMWTFDNNDVNVNLELVNHGGVINGNDIGIILLQNVPKSLQGRMIELVE